MQPFPSRFFRPPPLVQAALVLAAGCLLGACDRHSADDLPESYGHGSSHQKEYDRHETDSRDNSRHFSDTTGISPDQRHEDHPPEPTATPGATVSGRLFPSDH